MLGMAVPVMKEVVEVLYLTEEPHVLNADKYERLIGPIRATAFEEGIAITVRALQRKNGSLLTANSN